MHLYTIDRVILYPLYRTVHVSGIHYIGALTFVLNKVSYFSHPRSYCGCFTVFFFFFFFFFFVGSSTPYRHRMFSHIEHFTYKFTVKIYLAKIMFVCMYVCTCVRARVRVCVRTCW